MRALIPVDTSTRATTTGANQLSGYLCDLLVGEADPLARLTAARAAMQANKAAGPRRGAGAVALLAHAVPPVVHRVVTPLAARFSGWLFDLVITTVRVPRVALFVAGAVVTEVYPLVPLAPGHALGVALCHHRGVVHIGLHADADTMGDLDKLAAALPAAVAELADEPD
jgi:hypothetical protein